MVGNMLLNVFYIADYVIYSFFFATLTIFTPQFFIHLSV